MSFTTPSITIPVDLTNPGQFFACCGLLELADRLWTAAEGWFSPGQFHIACSRGSQIQSLLHAIAHASISNTMTDTQNIRLDELSRMPKKQRESTAGLEEEKKSLEALRREAPIVLGGAIDICIDWYCDQFSGGSRFKTWAGQQSVLDIAVAMHRGVMGVRDGFDSPILKTARGIGLPFNFDADLGGQGSALDIGFSFDPLAGSEATRITGTCKPLLELICFVGLQRFRPQEVPRENRFVYTAWNIPLLPSVAAAVVCGAVQLADNPRYEFKLLYRTKYLKSFLPSIPFQGDRDE